MLKRVILAAVAVLTLVGTADAAASCRVKVDNLFFRRAPLLHANSICVLHRGQRIRPGQISELDNTWRGGLAYCRRLHHTQRGWARFRSSRDGQLLSCTAG